MDFLRGVLGAATIRGSVDGVGGAIAVTADELVLTRGAGAGGKVERFSLGELQRVRVLPNPHASMFEAHFAGGRSARLMYYRDAAGDVERLRELLASSTGDAGSVGAAEEADQEVLSPLPVAATVGEGDELARSARLNRIILALIVIPLVIVYVYSTYSR